MRMPHRKLTTAELNRLSAEEFRALDKFPITIVLDNIRSGLNVGSIFRSADAFNVSKVVCCGITPAPPNREVLKSALGSTETVEWEYAENALECVEKLKVGINYAFVLGNEVTGVEQAVIDACHGALEIQQHGTKHSLNVAVCGGILMSSISLTK